MSDSETPRDQLREDEWFWVIFDTCTRPAYYADVHNLLAQPRGTLMRYEYRRAWLGRSAEAAIWGADNQPTKTLLIYGQPKTFSRGDSDPPAETSFDECTWVGTRLGEMVLIPMPEGETAYFDFRVLGYPHVAWSALAEILLPLVDVGETPFRKWVAISELTKPLKQLSTGSDQANWEAIVDVLGLPPSQFTGDSFWRLRPPLVRGREIRLTQEAHTRQSAGGDEVYRMTAGYGVFENQICEFPVVSYTPKDAGPKAARESLEASVSDASLLAVVEGSSVDLRGYTERPVRVKALQSNDVQGRQGAVAFTSRPSRTPWPVGPELSLTLIVRKRKARIFLAVLLVLAALFIGALATVSDMPLQGILIVVAAVLGIASGLAYTGRLELPKGGG